MLQFIRSKAGSFVVKILFVLLIGSFGIWGIGDFIRQKSPTDSTVITVGSAKIQGAAVQSEVQSQLTRLRARFGSTFTLEQAKSLGLINQIVDALVTRTLLDQTANAQHLSISGAQILASIQAEPAFRGKDGQFDRIVFRNVLAANGMSESQFEARIREDIARALVTEPVNTGTVPPQQMIDLLYQIRNERRIADWAFLSKASIKDAPPPDAKDLQDFYDKHHDAYTAKEYRSIAVLTMTAATVLDTIHPSDQELQDAYQQRQDEFNAPERRHVLQMLLPDEKTADDAASQLATGKDFFQIAKQLGNQEQSSVDLDWIKKTELPGAAGDFAFSAKDGDVSKPLKSDFGWNIVKLAGTKPAHLQTFDEAKTEVEAAIKNDQASDALYKLSNKVQDAIAGGASFDEIAQRFNLTPLKIPALDSAGAIPEGKPLADPPVPLDTLAKAAFSVGEGQLTGIQDGGDGNSFFLVKVEKVTPSALKPFDAVKTQVQDAWLSDKRASLVGDAASKLASQVNKDNSLASIAAAQKLTVSTSKPFLRNAEQTETGLPNDLIIKLFHLEIGQAVAVPTSDGEFVAQLKEIKPADAIGDTSGIDTIKQELSQNLDSEMTAQFSASLKRDFPVDIRQTAIDGLFASGSP